jgi:hypothetical protein
MALMHCDHARRVQYNPGRALRSARERKAVSHHQRRNDRPEHPSRIARIKLDL